MTDSIAERHAALLRNEFAALRDDADRLGVSLSAGLTVERAEIPADSGGIVSYLAWSGRAPAVTFLHGGGLNAHSWDSAVLSLGAAAIVPDLPGHGESSWRDNFDYAPATIAPLIARLLRDRGTGPFPVVGHSMGALTAVQLAADFPELVSSLVVVDITPSRKLTPNSERIRQFIRGQDSFTDYEEIIALAVTTGMGRDRRGLERGIILNTRRRADGRLVFKHHFASAPPDANAYSQDIRYLWPALEDLRIPVLLVRGTRGIVDEAQAAEFRQRVPAGAVVELDAGHNVQRDAPVELARAIAAHIGITAAA